MATNIIIICKTMIPSTPVGMLSGGMKTMRTPASSPDLNPIEHIWHTLREFLCNEYKPPNLSELKQGIKACILGITPEVIPKVVEVDVGPFGY